MYASLPPLNRERISLYLYKHCPLSPPPAASPFSGGALVRRQIVALEEQHVVGRIGVAERPVLRNPDGGVGAHQLRDRHARAHVGVILKRTSRERW